jgi:toxin-antitoxin system PIN domain toxin
MRALLDVNFLVALAWPNHIHHQAAVRWFEDNHERGWATCPLTQSGFVRVSSNQKVVPEARTPTEAIMLLGQLTGLDGHEFWADRIAIASSEYVDAERIVGYRQVTDAHLLALARDHGGKLVTFDRSIGNVASKDVAADALIVLPIDVA